MTRFVQGDLKSFDLLKDHDSVTEFPLKGKNEAAGEFYNHFLSSTNRYFFLFLSRDFYNYLDLATHFQAA